MNEPTAETQWSGDAHTWRPLRVLCTYRLVLAVILITGFAVTRNTDVLPVQQPELFLRTAFGYLGFAALALLLAIAHRPAFLVQVYAQILADILAITLLIHATAANELGLEVLILVAVAGGSLLTGARLGAFFAAVATVALLTEQVLAQLAGTAPGGGYTRVAMLGIGTFATALVGAMLARRARENAELAAQ
ncbi:MAG: ATPase, partial [Ectothiorhodospiraceae bacterium]